jgi:hypothetical protein
MEFEDSLRAWELIQQQLHRDSTVMDCMRAVIGHWECKKPHSAWQQVYAINFDSELSSLRDTWLAKVIREAPPIDFGVTGLWFGLFHPIRDAFGQNAETVTDFYIAGSTAVELDEKGDWATEIQYAPASGYAESKVLAAIHRVMYEKSDQFGKAFEYSCPAYVAFVLKHLFGEVDRSLIVESGNSVRIAMGWDAGDFLCIGTLTREGFHQRDVADYARSLREEHERFEKWFKERYRKSD